MAISAHTRPSAASSGGAHNGHGGSGSAEATIGELVATASRDVSLLIRQEVELAKTEMKAAATSASLGAAFLGGAGFLGFFAFFAITIAAGEGLHAAGIGRAYSFLIVTGAYLIVAGLLALFAVCSPEEGRAAQARDPDRQGRCRLDQAPDRRPDDQDRTPLATARAHVRRAHERPAARPLGSPGRLDERHPAAHRGGRQRPACPSGARVSGVLVVLASSADRTRRRRVSRCRLRSAGLRGQRQAPARLRHLHSRVRPGGPDPCARRAPGRAGGAGLRRLPGVGDGGAAPARSCAGSWSWARRIPCACGRRSSASSPASCARAATCSNFSCRGGPSASWYATMPRSSLT